MAVALEGKRIQEADKIDILELESRIKGYRSGQEDEERFKLYRLTRGVYGQRQLGVQMFRIKLPYGSVTSEQLIRIADVSDKYATGNLHITTRQDIQLHYVKLDDSPQVWVELAEKNITAREACGNTVRNITASAEAGVDPNEPFDVTPYAHAAAFYFLRNPICQEMGRKIKPAFSSSDLDTALTFMHDFGFIPKIVDGQRGFKVVVGGGLGAQALKAHTAFEFLEVDQIIPFMEAGLRVFDRYGEREKRHKARMKFLIKSLGIEHFLELVETERQANKVKSFPIDPDALSFGGPLEYFPPQEVNIKDAKKYDQWLKTNTFEQKQKGFYGIFIKVFLGDLSSEKARYLAKIVKKYAADDIRMTINQNILLKFIHADHLKEIYTVLDGFGFADPGFDSIADITACPGTDTCNLGVTNSTGLSGVLEEMLRNDYPDLVEEHHIKIKISGCMNACGQHTIGNIGFHGSSIKKEGKVIPAMQVLLGGGVDPSGQSFIADKITKVPTKRIPQLVSVVLDYFHEHRNEGEYFNHFYIRMGGRKHFYDVVKPFADVSNIADTDLMDWGQDHHYLQEIGVGECAGVILDMVGAIVSDAKEKLVKAQKELAQGEPADAIFYAYATYVIGAKAILLGEDIKCNTHKGIISDFQKELIDTKKLDLGYSYEDRVLSINAFEPTIDFATDFVQDAEKFLASAISYRNAQQGAGLNDKKVVADYYTA